MKKCLLCKQLVDSWNKVIVKHVAVKLEFLKLWLQFVVTIGLLNIVKVLVVFESIESQASFFHTVSIVVYTKSMQQFFFKSFFFC